LSTLHQSLPYFLALAASSFIYVAVADLIPSLHRKTRGSDAFKQIVLIACGIGLIYAAQTINHRYIHDDAPLQQTQEQ